jgi:hypothetical protein
MLSFTKPSSIPGTSNNTSLYHTSLYHTSPHCTTPEGSSSSLDLVEASNLSSSKPKFASTETPLKLTASVETNKQKIVKI